MVIMVQEKTRRISFRTIALGVAVAATVGWLIVFPMIESYFKQFEERPTTYVVEELTPFEMLRVRSAKLAIFSIFAYVGACVGSFLNVVAGSAPRGEPVTTRSSLCPHCGQKIRRRDNIPIFSFFALKGRCRTCQAPISMRYLMVELVASGIFALLFLVELVTGASNVPGGMHYHYAGIVWIILYTKWPVVGIYFYHTMMFSMLLMFSLMELDRLKCPRAMAFSILIVFSLLMICMPALHTVAFDDLIGVSVSASLPTWVEQLITCLAGGIAGLLAGRLVHLIGMDAPETVALVLLGLTIGWQALVTVMLIWIALTIAMALFARFPRTARLSPRWFGPTMVLLAAGLLHHPFWNRLAMLW
ncbi:MAG: prepilin peptidase [Planctomycetota bacterium]